MAKVANGEWRWIDEAGCVMHTATSKPAILRPALRDNLGVELHVLRHEKFAAEMGDGSSSGAAPESLGDLIIFDMDWKDVTKETGNTKVFCQDPAKFELGSLDALQPGIRAALDQVLALELRR